MADLWLPDFKPVSPSVYDDEFADSSLSGSWTELDNDSILTVTEGDSGLRLTSTGATGGVAGVYRDTPAGDWAIWTKCSLSDLNATDWTWAGLFLAQDLDGSPTTADILMLCFYHDVGDPHLALLNLTEYNQSSLIVWTQLNDAWYSQHLYFRFRYLSGTYYADWSTDGIGWIELWNGSKANIAHMGLGIHNATGSTEAATFQFFRCDTSTPALTNVMYGRRVDPESPPVDGGLALRRSGHTIPIGSMIQHRAAGVRYG